MLSFWHSSPDSSAPPTSNTSATATAGPNLRRRVVRFSQFEEQPSWQEQQQPVQHQQQSQQQQIEMNSSGNDRIEVKESDMKPNMISKAMDIVREGVQKNSQDKDIASYVKDNCEKQFGPTWHCVVGRSFGSRVSYELETFALLKVNQHTVLIFKCG